MPAIIKPTNKPKANTNNQIIKQLLTNLEIPHHKHTRESPEKIAATLEELVSGSKALALKRLKKSVWKENTKDLPLVQVGPVRFYSLCAHHMLPFLGRWSILFKPSHHLVGLSALPEAVCLLAKRMQLQEEFTADIGDLINQALRPRAWAVWVQAEHLCQSMRHQPQTPSILTTQQNFGSWKNYETSYQNFLDGMKNEA
jgi:GTP cyclohydrolase I